MFAIIATAVVTLLVAIPATVYVVFWMVNRGAILEEVGIVNMAASRGEDYVEKNVGGCLLRQPLQVKYRVLPFVKFDQDFLLRRILRQAQKLDKGISLISYKGVCYAN